MKLLSILGPMSGSMGGITAARNKGGQYLRFRTKPTNPNSVRQQAVRAILGTLSSAWSSSLSDEDRALWAAYGQANPVQDALGQSITLSGMAWFCRLNSRLVDAGETALAVPPVGSGPAALETITPEVKDDGSLSLVFTGTPDATSFLQVWATLPGNAGTSPNRNQARLVGYSAAAPTTPESFTMPFPGQVDQVVQIYAQVMDEAGQVSASLVAPATVIVAV